MQIITAPSKTQNCRLNIYEKFSVPQFLDKSSEIVERLRQLSENDLSDLMKTSEKLTLSTVDKIRNFSVPFHPANSSQAIFTFKGDAYDALTPENYSDEQLNHGQRHLRILSGLYGILRPLDLMQPYRLEMGATLKVGTAANLHTFWRNDVTQALNTSLTEQSEKIVINLASQEYARVIDKNKLNGKLVTVVFKQPHKSGLKTIPIHSKRARGEMIHFIIQNKVDKSEDIKGFNRDGYSYEPGGSTTSSWLFVKKQR